MVYSSMAALRSSRTVRNQHFDYFLILDFEATCDNAKKLEPQEIIEFPVIKFDWRNLREEKEARFHEYVQPEFYPNLTPFCIELTGIVQDMVDGRPNIRETLQKFDQWMRDHIFSQNKTFAFVTCGDWDLKKMLPSQCSYLGIPRPSYFNSWINIKKSFCEVTKVYPKGMMQMLQHLQIAHQGRHHSGIDDTTNIAAILKELLIRGHVFKITGSLPS